MSYKEDWEQALADGSGMERIPSGWISVREIEYECGVKYEFLVGLGNRKKYGMVYDSSFNLHISPGKAVRLRAEAAEVKAKQRRDRKKSHRHRHFDIAARTERPFPI